MRRHRPELYGCLVLAVLFAAIGPLRAEVVCEEPVSEEDRDCVYLLVPNNITEEPDPIGSSGEPHSLGGAIPDDVEFADASTQVVTGNGMTIAVWAVSAAGNKDIVFSEWRPGGWQEEPLTFGGSDESDPRASIGSNGEIYVTWWETDAPRRVRVARRDPVTFQWHQPAAFNGLYGSRPSVLVLDQEVLVAFERQAWSGGQEIVVRRARRSGGAVHEDIVAMTPREMPLIIELHLHGDRPFIDWIHNANFYGYSEYLTGKWGVTLGTRPLTQRAGAVGVRRNVVPVALNP